MGGAFAVRSASIHPEVWSALIIVSSFDSLTSVMRDKCAVWVGPAGAPVAEIICAFASVRAGISPSESIPSSWAENVRLPVLVVHGDRDVTVRLARGQKLYDSFASPERKWVLVPGGDHERVLVTPMPLYREMAEWILRWAK